MTIEETWTQFTMLAPQPQAIMGKDDVLHLVAEDVDWDAVEAAARDLALAVIDEWASIASSTLTEPNKIEARRELRARIEALGGEP